jgi:protein-S-isoprenylcysteine O-methyltransferase Ste14
MDEDLLFRLLFIVIYAIFFSVRIGYRINSARREPENRYQLNGMANKVLIIAILGYIASIIIYMVFPQRISGFQLAMPLWLRWLGVIVAMCSILLVEWTHRTLGKQYSSELAIQKEHILVTTGPYSRIRHPMYTALNLFSFSMALTTSNLIILLLAVLVMLPFPWIVRAEEEMLLEAFGDEYQKYMRRTGRFFPLMRKPSKRNEILKEI